MKPWNQGIYRHNNLVYHRSNKCAGTFFSEFFSNHGWKPIPDPKTIRPTDVNFGILIDPIKRRAKAITERICMAGMQEYIDNKSFQKFIEDICIVDEHLIPYSHQRIKQPNAVPIGTWNLSKIKRILCKSWMRYKSIR